MFLPRHPQEKAKAMLREVGSPPSEAIETMYSFGRANGSWWPTEVGDRSLVLATLDIGQCVKVRGDREFRNFMSARANRIEARKGIKLDRNTIGETLHIWRTA